MVENNTHLLSQVGWRKLAKKRQGCSAISDDLGALPHKAARYLNYLRQLGTPVHWSAPPKSPDDLQTAVNQEPHPLAVAHQEFLWEESLEMCKRRHTMVLPFSAVKHLRGVQVSPPGVVPQANRRPRTVADLTFWGVNASTVASLTPQKVRSAMVRGRRLAWGTTPGGLTWTPRRCLTAEKGSTMVCRRLHISKDSSQRNS